MFKEVSISRALNSIRWLNQFWDWVWNSGMPNPNAEFMQLFESIQFTGLIQFYEMFEEISISKTLNLIDTLIKFWDCVLNPGTPNPTPKFIQLTNLLELETKTASDIWYICLILINLSNPCNLSNWFNSWNVPRISQSREHWNKPIPWTTSVRATRSNLELYTTTKSNSLLLRLKLPRTLHELNVFEQFTTSIQLIELLQFIKRPKKS